MSKRNIRKRRAVDDEDEDLGNGAEEEQGLSAHDIKLLQKNRQRRTVRRRAAPRHRRRQRRPCGGARPVSAELQLTPPAAPTQGVDSAALAMPEKARRAPAPADGDDDGAGPDVLRAAFNRERLRVTDADDPQM
jgi:xanthine/CO dehydrogenase XdhC/CoxF family maturation factor